MTSSKAERKARKAAAKLADKEARAATDARLAFLEQQLAARSPGAQANAAAAVPVHQPVANLDAGPAASSTSFAVPASSVPNPHTPHHQAAHGNNLANLAALGYTGNAVPPHRSEANSSTRAPANTASSNRSFSAPHPPAGPSSAPAQSSRNKAASSKASVVGTPMYWDDFGDRANNRVGAAIVTSLQWLLLVMKMYWIQPKDGSDGYWQHPWDFLELKGLILRANADDGLPAPFHSLSTPSQVNYAAVLGVKGKVQLGYVQGVKPFGLSIEYVQFLISKERSLLYPYARTGLQFATAAVAKSDDHAQSPVINLAIDGMYSMSGAKLYERLKQKRALPRLLFILPASPSGYPDPVLTEFCELAGLDEIATTEEIARTAREHLASCAATAVLEAKLQEKLLGERCMACKLGRLGPYDLEAHTEQCAWVDLPNRAPQIAAAVARSATPDESAIHASSAREQDSAEETTQFDDASDSDALLSETAALDSAAARVTARNAAHRAAQARIAAQHQMPAYRDWVDSDAASSLASDSTSSSSRSRSRRARYKRKKKAMQDAADRQALTARLDAERQVEKDTKRAQNQAAAQASSKAHRHSTANNTAASGNATRHATAASSSGKRMRVDIEEVDPPPKRRGREASVASSLTSLEDDVPVTARQLDDPINIATWLESTTSVEENNNMSQEAFPLRRWPSVCALCGDANLVCHDHPYSDPFTATRIRTVIHQRVNRLQVSVRVPADETAPICLEHRRQAQLVRDGLLQGWPGSLEDVFTELQHCLDENSQYVTLIRDALDYPDISATYIRLKKLLSHNGKGAVNGDFTAKWDALTGHAGFFGGIGHDLLAEACQRYVLAQSKSQSSEWTSTLAPMSLVDFIKGVLVPLLANQLITRFLNLANVEQADTIRLASDEFGTLLYCSEYTTNFLRDMAVLQEKQEEAATEAKADAARAAAHAAARDEEDREQAEAIAAAAAARAELARRRAKANAQANNNLQPSTAEAQPGTSDASLSLMQTQEPPSSIGSAVNALVDSLERGQHTRDEEEQEVAAALRSRSNKLNASAQETGDAPSRFTRSHSRAQ